MTCPACLRPVDEPGLWVVKSRDYCSARCARSVAEPGYATPTPHDVPDSHVDGH